MLPLSPSPTYSITAQQPVLPRPALGTPKASPLYTTGMPRPKKKKGPNERTHQTPEKIQLSHKEIANLSDAQFKTLVIRKL